MVKLILPNSAPPGQESQKCLKNSATDLVTSRKKLELSSSRGRTSSPRGRTSSLRGQTWSPRAVALFLRHFWLSWPGGAELGKMSFTIDFVYENYNF